MARRYARGASKDVEREMHKFKRGKLKSGKAWVQFCVFDSSATDDNFPTGFAYDYSWKHVIAVR